MFKPTGSGVQYIKSPGNGPKIDFKRYSELMDYDQLTRSKNIESRNSRRNKSNMRNFGSAIIHNTFDSRSINAKKN